MRSSPLSHKSSSPAEYLNYLKAKARVDALTRSFYFKKLWHNWHFRIYCRRRSSEDLFLNRVTMTYGEDCLIFYGDWFGGNNLKGCRPSLTYSTRKMFKKGFRLVDVDEHKTSYLQPGSAYTKEKRESLVCQALLHELQTREQEVQAVCEQGR